MKTKPDQIAVITEAVRKEMERAISMHGPLQSAHEAYGVINEEFEEFWDEVKKKRHNRNKKMMREELIQTAAMCCRAIYDLKL